MTILDACIREALRVNSPATILIPRMSSTEAVTLGGYKIPANTLITVNVFGALHNLGEWEEPAEFRPERYLVPSSEGDGEGKGTSVPASWIPFGLGRRQCPAKNFTLLELRVLVAHLLKKYKWELPPDSIHLKKGVQNAWSPFAFNYPKDLDVTFEALE
jgi:cytochrome P450